MAYQQRDNSGTLFKNDKRREGKNDPEYTGTAVIDGQEFYMDCWVKRPENKKPFFSFSFKAKTGQRRQQSETTQTQPPAKKPRPPSAPDPDFGINSDSPDIPFDP